MWRFTLKLRRLILLEALILKSSVSVIFAASVMSYRDETSILANWFGSRALD
jgi:hypothetical protein